MYANMFFVVFIHCYSVYPPFVLPFAYLPIFDARSARSLSKSPVPAFGAWLAHSCDNGWSPPRSGNQQSVAKEPLLDRTIFPQSAPPNLSTKNMLAVVSTE